MIASLGKVRNIDRCWFGSIDLKSNQKRWDWVEPEGYWWEWGKFYYWGLWKCGLHVFPIRFFIRGLSAKCKKKATLLSPKISLSLPFSLSRFISLTLSLWHFSRPIIFYSFCSRLRTKFEGKAISAILLFLHNFIRYVLWNVILELFLTCIYFWFGIIQTIQQFALASFRFRTQFLM